MPVETEKPNVAELTAEVERLRKTNVELLESKHALKTKVAELEASNVKLQEKAEAEVAAKYEATINVPLKRLATKLSPVPDIFMQEFAKDYRLDIDDKTGALILLDLDGKPVKGRDNKPVEVSEQGLYSQLTSNKANPERCITYGHLLTYRGASGGGASGMNRSTSNQPSTNPTPKPKAPEISFGLK